MTLYDYNGDEVGGLECVLTVEKDSISISDATIQMVEYDYYYDYEIGEYTYGTVETSVDFELSLSKGATIEKLTGTEFNLSTADVDEFQEIYEQLEDLFGEGM